MGSSERSLLDAATATFIQGGVSILVSSCHEEHLTVVRGLGCRVSSDRRQVTVLVPDPHPLLETVRTSGRIAVAFTLPSTHRAVQLKGDDAARARWRKDDAELYRRYVGAFAADLGPLGFGETFVRALTWSEPDVLAAVAFHPRAAFLQTPGPRAGAALDPSETAR